MEQDEVAQLQVELTLLRKQIRNARIIEARLEQRRLMLHAIFLAMALVGLVVLIHQGLTEASLPMTPEFVLIICERSKLPV